MPNLFLGFPVPRAKIAGMIEGYAESLSTYNHLYYLTLLDTLDAISQQIIGTATITLVPEYLQLKTGTTIHSLARIWKVPYYTVPGTSWAKARKFRTKVRIIALASTNPLIQIYTGNNSAPLGFGFQITGHSIYGISGNGSSLDFILLETIAAGAIDIIRDLEAVFTPGSKIEFYIDGVKKGEVTTKLPTGITSSQYLLWVEIYNNAATDDIMLISHWKIYQEP